MLQYFHCLTKLLLKAIEIGSGKEESFGKVSIPHPLHCLFFDNPPKNTNKFSVSTQIVE